MKISIDIKKVNAVDFLRRAGYVFKNKSGEELNFVRTLSKSGYPRLHVYAKQEGTKLLINLHLDHKRETYGKATRHHGEYEDSKVLEDEAVRIRQIIR